MARPGLRLTDRWAVDRVFEPAIGEAERQSRYATWRLAVERSRGWAHLVARRNLLTILSAAILRLAGSQRRLITPDLRLPSETAPFFLSTRRTPGRSS